MTDLPPLSPDVLPKGIRSRFIDGINGLRMHVLEAGEKGKPLVLLLHGFPELAYSWRDVMVPLAAEGFYVVAPDQRGYGRTSGQSTTYDESLAPVAMPKLAADARALVSALGYEKALLMGHDFGSPVSAWSSILYPEVFRAVVLMSAPFAGPPASTGGTSDFVVRLKDAMAALPRPRKHYHAYYATREANEHMWHPPQGIHDFLRGYFHHKSADWAENKPYRLKEASADELAKLPTYYVMDRDQTMAETVAPYMPSAAHIAANTWLPDRELAVYAEEYGRTGFQGGFNWYRTRFDAALNEELVTYAGRSIDIPSMFVAGASDWGVFQVPGAFERMQTQATTRMEAAHLIPGAGHWVMQERPDETLAYLIPFCRKHAALVG
ncbi:soluble epoxide hydrolase [Variibacter gotjawalensis]|uniref:Soluble epoxide hydrolase n=1 Tax=Variibacter gotjawalensis TaxID=1333996 RepID=A0A0S3PNK3_9BRAD|nr:alpha/beta hydrolase [Variibacter gotjawalensis]NIK47810.1 pimeloyl-ACP methyl ester carboxylesterase [Variibacter gotjawalensis]RZS49697.1 pimeloyl-ACP methyl ester carboxylesterase [Variibacter gotjawalensis]BAT57526.1 soluble epoxide hydrolase [Variibacter gotjawalensis]